MGYPEDIREYKAIDGMLERIKQLDEDKLKHQKSDDCTHTPDCPICKKYEEWKKAEDPTL